MIAFIFALIALSLLIYGVEYTIYAYEKYKALENKKMSEEISTLTFPLIERYTCPVQILQTSVMIDPILLRVNCEEVKKKIIEKHIANAKEQMIKKMLDSDQFVEVTEDEENKFYYDRHIYHLSLRVVQKASI